MKSANLAHYQVFFDTQKKGNLFHAIRRGNATSVLMTAGSGEKLDEINYPNGANKVAGFYYKNIFSVVHNDAFCQVLFIFIKRDCTKFN